ncbi:MAG: inositol monophosphatase family protein [Candidatus Rifleibacteriota bacterium]
MINLEFAAQKASQIAQNAGQLLKENQLKDHQITHKGTVDLVTEMDIAAEKLIRKQLKDDFPEISFFGEEDGGSSWQNGLVWVVDPLDGTTNYAHGLDHYSVSIALCENGTPLVGALAHPDRDVIYHCWKEGGAYKNNQRIEVNKTGDINSALAVTGFPYNRRECMPEILNRIEIMLNNVQGLRRFGSAALDLCFVANGIFSIFWENNLKPWDIAAGMLLVKEAGGNVTCFNGKEMKLDSSELLATNGFLHKQTVELLKTTSKVG